MTLRPSTRADPLVRRPSARAAGRTRPGHDLSAISRRAPARLPAGPDSRYPRRVPLTPAQLESLSQAFPARAVARRDADGYAVLHAAIAEALRPFARALEFDMSGFVARDQQTLLSRPPHLLFVWCDEADGMASLYALPEADVAPN